ncbi:alpha/beta-hydrolase [Astrocystis sublimbata]|nr:alpha/beta-hydrolase [Astrocystis sublimbata]
MPPTRIPQPSDFAPLKPSLHVSLTYPSVPETTTCILLLFHGLGDSEASFATFAKNMNLPGVLSISVRGTSPLPPSLLGLPLSSPPSHDDDDDESGRPTTHFHWGDDLTLSPTTGELDGDPGFSGAETLVLRRLVRETLMERCGWDTRDILLFGFGQGGSLALGLASRVRLPQRVTATEEGHQQQHDPDAGTLFKGAISIGGALPTSMIPTLSARPKAKTPTLLCYGRNSEALDGDAIRVLRTEFLDVREAKWRKGDDGMPRNREEMLPVMQFLAERMRAW